MNGLQRSLSALWIGAISLSSPATQHDYGARAPKGFIEQVLWPEFSELDRALQIYLHEVTLRVIREEVYSDTSEAEEVPEGAAAELMAKIRLQRGLAMQRPCSKAAVRRCG